MVQRMRLCRFAADTDARVRVGLITADDTLFDVTAAGVDRMQDLLERADVTDELVRLTRAGLPQHWLDEVRRSMRLSGHENPCRVPPERRAETGRCEFARQRHRPQLSLIR